MIDPEKVTYSDNMFSSPPRQTRPRPTVLEVEEVPNGPFIDGQLKGKNVNYEGPITAGKDLTAEANKIPGLKGKQIINPPLQKVTEELTQTAGPVIRDIEEPPYTQETGIEPKELKQILKEKINSLKNTIRHINKLEGNHVLLVDNSSQTIIQDWSFRIQEDI